jgi:hypothetical protein
MGGGQGKQHLPGSVPHKIASPEKAKWKGGAEMKP